ISPAMTSETTMTQIRTRDSGSRSLFFFAGAGTSLGAAIRSVGAGGTGGGG
ncbi:MAG: hypothetical protein QOE30_654, partial [Mycobacterium sp.]|nr:hypothetical protein [Mycobacterium sp.]